jgi:hypothetical protein
MDKPLKPLKTNLKSTNLKERKTMCTSSNEEDSLSVAMKETHEKSIKLLNSAKWRSPLLQAKRRKSCAQKKRKTSSDTSLSLKTSSTIAKCRILALKCPIFMLLKSNSMGSNR